MRKVVRAAVDLYQRFRGQKPKRIKVVNFDLPDAVMVIGHVEAIAYNTTWEGKREYYVHEFQSGSRPLLCASSDGKQLLLIGGRYVFDGDHGIVDRNKDGTLNYDPEHGQFAGFFSRRQAD